ncbi:MAG: methyltransferase domain-containing protein [Candidatus Cloacimonetes bacterium]|nr:methyltransferase domain-containing protein [Candidatus Cloacimonadota bacterium]
MAIPILHFWRNYYDNPDEGLGSSYERVIINNTLMEIISRYQVKSILEAPIFGFTGTSGINSMQAAISGCEIRLLDDNMERSALIANLWDRCGLTCKIDFTEDFMSLDYEDKSYDLSWNFSAMWFVKDFEKFLSELSRVTRKVILISVPNQHGLGYISQKLSGKEDLKKHLKEEYIEPTSIINELFKLNWKLVEDDYFDCPPWPDIGMPKAKFLSKFGLGFIFRDKDKNRKPITILDYYTGKKPDFPQEMMRYSILEKFAPRLFKRFWAHHHYYLFERIK